MLKVLSYWNLNKHINTDRFVRIALKVLSYWNLNIGETLIKRMYKSA